LFSPEPQEFSRDPKLFSRDPKLFSPAAKEFSRGPEKCSKLLKIGPIVAAARLSDGEFSRRKTNSQ